MHKLLNRLHRRNRRIYNLYRRQGSALRRRLTQASVIAIVLVLAIGFMPMSWISGITPKTAHTPTKQGGSANGYALSLKQKIFRVDEYPQLTLQVPGSQQTSWLEQRLGVAVAHAETPIATTVTYDDKKVDIPVKVEQNADGSYRLTLEPVGRIKPGSYTITATIQTASGPQKVSQTFAWGVLAINTTRPVYLPGETAEIQMGVLSSKGNTICDAPLNLTATDLAGNESKLDVKRSDVCKGDSYVELPDYTAEYKLGGVGKYRLDMRLANSDYTMTEYIEVRASVPFDIQRTAPTRLFPPATYKTEVVITSHQSFNGTVTEKLPAGFTIVDPGTAKVAYEQEAPILTWTATMQSGTQTKFSYAFKSPQQSPAFYEMSPLTLAADGHEVFREARQWQLAGDAAIAFVKQTVQNVTTAANSNTLSVTSTTGNTLVLLVGTNSDTVLFSGVSDSAGNTWVMSGTAPSQNPPHDIWNGNSFAMAYALNANAVTSVTVTIATGNRVYAYNVVEFSNIATASAVDQSAASSNTANTTHTSTALTTTNADDLIIGGVSTQIAPATINQAGSSPTSGWTSLSTGSATIQISGAYHIVSATGTYSLQWNTSTSRSTVMAIMAFKQAGCNPTTDELMRGGTFFCSGIKAGQFWAT